MFLAFLLISPLLWISLAFSSPHYLGYSLEDHEPIPSKVEQSALDVRFGLNVKVTDNTSGYTQQVEPTLGILSDGHILVGWKEADTHDGPGRRVGFAYSTDDGKNFSSNILMPLNAPGEYQSDPWIVVDKEDNVYYTFLEGGGPGEGMIVVKTTDGGVTWQNPVQASDTSGFDDKETVCVDDNGTLYLTWDMIVNDTVWDLRFTKSTDGGSTFEPTSTFQNVWFPYITCSPNGTLYVTTINQSSPEVWWDQVWITRSTDKGNSWSTPVRVNPLGSGGLAIITVVDLDSEGNVYVAYSWGSEDNTDIYVTRSPPGGRNWSTPVRVNDVSTGMQRMVEMVIDENDTIHVAWLDAQSGDWHVYYDRTEDGGVTFSSDVRITSEGTPLSYTRPGDYFTMRPGPDGRLYVVWTDGRGDDQDIYFAKQDLSPPELEHTPPTTGLFQIPLIFTANATDDDHITSVALYYQLGQAEMLYRQNMTEISPGVYQTTLNIGLLAGLGLHYYIVAEDAAGRQTQVPSSPTTMYSISVWPNGQAILGIAVSSILGIAVIVVVLRSQKQP
jgi:uncharacterized cupin superfamily protein